MPKWDTNATNVNGVPLHHIEAPVRLGTCVCCRQLETCTRFHVDKPDGDILPSFRRPASWWWCERFCHCSIPSHVNRYGGKSVGRAYLWNVVRPVHDLYKILVVLCFRLDFCSFLRAPWLVINEWRNVPSLEAPFCLL